MTQSNCLDIIIVGAGLGGLAAAVALSRNGHRVTVLEATKELVTVSAKPCSANMSQQLITAFRRALACRYRHLARESSSPGASKTPLKANSRLQRHLLSIASVMAASWASCLSRHTARNDLTRLGGVFIGQIISESFLRLRQPRACKSCSTIG